MAGVVPPETAKAAAAAAAPAAEQAAPEKVDYLNLPCPIPYEEIHREAMSESDFRSRHEWLAPIVCFSFSSICDSVVWLESGC